jgi:hypothetical protein
MPQRPEKDYHELLFEFSDPEERARAARAYGLVGHPDLPVRAWACGSGPEASLNSAIARGGGKSTNG